MTSADSLFNVAVDFHTKGDMDAARLHYLAALRADPNHVATLVNLGDLLSRKNQVFAGAAIAARAAALRPENGGIWTNYGVFLTRLERYPDARVALNKAVELSPDHIGAWHALLLLALRQGECDEAITHYNIIKSLGGDNPTIQNDLAHIYLTKGDLEVAFEVYESRWHILNHMEPWDFHIPEWQGENLKGKSILVHAEQGYGDTIMVSRFLPALVARSARVSLAVEPAMVSLFEAQGWGVEIVDIHELDEASTRQYDFHSPLYSMMRWLGVRREDIDPKPFLKAPQIAVPPVFNGMLNVGICWASGRRGNHLDWRRRVSLLEDWLALVEVPNIQLWSLTPGEEAQSEIVQLGAEGSVLDYVTAFADFAETAAFIQNLDLVISVDTAVAHLAAALGKPTWMLSQFTPCWRWWDLENGTGKPWYDTMEILPQHEPGGWKLQLDTCRMKLGLMAEALQ